MVVKWLDVFRDALDKAEEIFGSLPCDKCIRRERCLLADAWKASPYAIDGCMFYATEEDQDD
jgi:hypothetical protein